MKNYCLLSTETAASRKLFNSLKNDNVRWIWISTKEDFQKIDKSIFHYIFVFRWPHIIPENLINSFNFIGFHTSNLPDGRGGSPIQNQIMDGTTITRVNAIKLSKEIDAGPVYCSEQITLQGTVNDIWNTIAEIAIKLIRKILFENLIPEEQLEKNFQTYKRRKNNEINQNFLNSATAIYNFIRMLDGDDYPSAFLETQSLKIEFSRASLKDDFVICDAKITVKKENK